MKSHLAIAIVVVLVLCGCRSTPSKNTASSARPVSRVLSFEERSDEFYNRQPRIIPTEAVRPQLDYKSELRIIVNTNELLKHLRPANSVLTSLTPEQQARLSQLTALLQAARQYLQDFDSFAKEFDRLKDAPPSPENQNRLQSAIRQQARSGLNLFDPLDSYLTAKIKAENPGIAPADLEQEKHRLTVPIIPPDKVLDFAALSEFVGLESARVARQASGDAMAVRQQGAVFLRMRASLPMGAREPLALHIQNYDTLRDSNVAQEPRISFQMSEDDRQRLSAETKVVAEAARFVRDVQNKKSDIRQSLDAVLNAVRVDLNNWKQTVGQLDELRTKIAPVIDGLERATLPPGEAGRTQVVNDAKRILVTVTNEIRAIRDNIAGLAGNANVATDPAAVIMDTASALSAGLHTHIAQAQGIVTNLTTTLGRLQDLVDGVRNSAPQLLPTIQDLERALQPAAPSSVQAIKGLLDLTLARYPALVATVKNLTSKAKILEAEAKLPPIELDANLIDVAVQNPPDGFISLASNLPRGGLTIDLDTALVTRKDPDSPAVVTPVDHRQFEVEKFGLVNTWSANLIFVKRLGDLDSGERDVEFSPAPSVSWTLHYNPPPGDHPRNKFWDTVYPGVGLNVAALNWDEGIQIGVGGHLSFFKDLLIMGGGYNLNESRHGMYVFLGLGLFQAFNQLGLNGGNFPLGQ